MTSSMTEPTDAQASNTPPDWVADSKVIQDALLYVRTLREALNHPWKFASEWALGRRTPMNPLSFFSVSTGLLLAARGFWRWVFEVSAEQSFFEKTSAPSYLLPILMGLYLHRFMLRGTGARLSTTVGAILFAVGSWNSVVSLMLLTAQVDLTQVAPGKLANERNLALIIGVSVFGLCCRSLAVGAFVAGAHQRRLVSTVLWSLSFYLLPLALGLTLMAIGTALKAV